jgi:hypothetical protein
MSKRFTTVLSAVFTAILFVTVGILAASDVPDEIIIQNEVYKSDKKGGVKLTHKKHNVDYKVACTDCHHVFKDGKQVWKEGDPVQKCSECHDPEKGEKGEPMKLQNAYHKNCKDCHKDLEKEGKPTGPFKKCNDCHEKK